MVEIPHGQSVARVDHISSGSSSKTSIPELAHAFAPGIHDLFFLGEFLTTGSEWVFNEAKVVSTHNYSPLKDYKAFLPVCLLVRTKEA